MVDYVLVEVIKDMATKIKTDALLLSDGTITSIRQPSLGTIKTCELEEGEFYRIIVRHRNHLDVMSSGEAMVLDGELHYDFSCAITQAAGLNQMVQMAPDIFALKTGDIDGNGVMTLGDFNRYMMDVDLFGVYARGDLNFDGMVNEADLILYLSHVTDMGVLEIRY